MAQAEKKGKKVYHCTDGRHGKEYSFATEYAYHRHLKTWGCKTKETSFPSDTTSRRKK